MSVRPRRLLSGELERSRDGIKNQMHIWQGRYVIEQLLDQLADHLEGICIYVGRDR